MGYKYTKRVEDRVEVLEEKVKKLEGLVERLCTTRKWSDEN